MAILPYNRSAWIKQKVRDTFSGRKPSKTTLYSRPPLISYAPGANMRKLHRKLLFVISAMFAFHNARRNVTDKEKLQERLGRIPVTLLDGFLSKFTDSARGSTKCVALSFMGARTYRGAMFAERMSHRKWRRIY